MSVINNKSILKIQYNRDIVARLNAIKGDILKVSIPLGSVFFFVYSLLI